jgi:solute carrier family 45, member 1/2/4
MIIITMTITLCLADEVQLDKTSIDNADGTGCFSAFADLFRSLKNMPPSMYKVLAVTAGTWVRTPLDHLDYSCLRCTVCLCD